MKPRATGSGFTLLELSIVIIIISLITGMGMVATIGALESARQVQTQNKMDVIEKALFFYRRVNFRMPCPGDPRLLTTDTNYGKQAGAAATPNLSTGLCTGATPAANVGTAGGAVEGSVPTWDLNLPNEFMYDGWGHKFVYAVDSNATDADAFTTMTLPESCSITVKDGSGNTRSTGAVYVLMSYGPIGHGGYVQAGTRMNAKLTNTDAQKNCHCDANANATAYDSTYVQKDRTENSTSSLDVFDDIVRYKERWQLQTYDDVYASTYLGPQVLAGYALGGAVSNSVYDYHFQCGKLKKLTNLNPVATGNGVGGALVSSNGYVLAFSNAGCYLYTVAANGTLNTGVPVSACPAYDGSNKIAVSSNSYLAITISSSPYVKLFKFSGGTFVAIADPSSPTPLGRPTSLSLTANYLAISDGNNAAGHTEVYQRSNDTFTGMATQPPSIPASPYSVALGDTETYFGVTTQGTTGNSPAVKIYLWHIYGASNFTALSAISINAAGVNTSGNDNPAGLAFSPDGKYFAFGGLDGDNINIYKIDTGDTFTRLALPLNWTNSTTDAGLQFAFSSDSRYIAMLTNDTTKPLVLFRQTNGIRYHLAPLPDTYPANAGQSVSFKR